MRKNVMLADKYSERRLMKWPVPWLVQPKINGRRCLAVIERDKVTLLSSQGNEIYSCPHINEQLKSLSWAPCVLDGELYSQYLTFETLASTVATRHPTFYSDQVQYWHFDMCSSQMASRRVPAIHYPWPKSIIPVPTYIASTVADVELLLDTIYQDGFEGIIIRHPDAPYEPMSRKWMMKLKPSLVGNFQICGYQEEVSIKGELKNSLGSFTCKTADGKVFNVGSGFTEYQRLHFWELRNGMLGDFIVVRYQGLTAKGIPYFSRFVGLV